MCLHAAELTNKEGHRVKFIIRHRCGYCQDDMYIIQPKERNYQHQPTGVYPCI